MIAPLWKHFCFHSLKEGARQRAWLNEMGMIVAAIGKGGGLHLGRAAEQIALRDLYLAVMEDKRILVAREDIPSRCRISAIRMKRLTIAANAAE